jgi:hypothetical protein
MKLRMVLLASGAAVALVAKMVGPAPAANRQATAGATAKSPRAATAARKLPSCASPQLLCAETDDSEAVFGEGV